MCLLVLPLLVAILCRLLPRWLRPIPVILVTLAVIVILSLQLKGLQLIGTLLPAAQFVSAFHFQSEQPAVAAAYLAGARVVFLKLALLLLVVMVLTWWAWRSDVKEPTGAGRSIDRIEGFFLGGAAAVTAVAWLMPPTHTVYDHSVLYQSVHALAEHESDLPTNRSAAQLLASVDQLTHTPAVAPATPYRGKARNYDVVLFIMETIPRRCAPFDGDVSDLPTVAALRRDAFVPRRHYTSQPWSSYALFAALGGWYPPPVPQNAMWNPMWQSFEANLPTGLNALRRAGYLTSIFAPYRSRGEPDEQMFRTFGFDSVLYAPPDSMRPEQQSDSLALDRLYATVDGARARGQRFLVAFIPQVSHGPWIDMDPAHPAANLGERCRRLVRLQDDWLGRIMANLRAHGGDRNVLVAFTGDHGIRTHAEDPSYWAGHLDEYAFGVPMLLAAPGVAGGMVTIDQVTSHVDLMPTIVDLLGICPDQYETEGMPFYASGLDQRMIIYLARYRQGVDGFHEGDHFVQWARAEDVVSFSRDSLDFGGHLVPVPDTTARAAARQLGDVMAVHQAFLKQAFEAHVSRSAGPPGSGGR